MYIQKQQKIFENIINYVPDICFGKTRIRVLVLRTQNGNNVPVEKYDHG